APGSVVVRSFHVATTLSELLVFHHFNRHRRERFGFRLRVACERLGLAFIKIGQILSTRYDLLPADDCRELQGLLDAVPPIPYAEVERLFLQDFGRLPEACFESFDRQPVASASVSQVHQAVLRGNKVAVKVRRPGVAATLQSDIRIFRFLARAAQLFSWKLRHVDLQEVLRQAESWMRMETDFLNEVGNIEAVIRYYNSGAGERAGEYGRALVFPKPYREFCSSGILTMEFLEGVLVRNFRSVAGDPAYDAERSLCALVRATLRALVVEEEFYFHGDPHPSNILIMPGGRIGLLDLGLLG